MHLVNFVFGGRIGGCNFWVNIGSARVMAGGEHVEVTVGDTLCDQIDTNQKSEHVEVDKHNSL